MSKDRYYRQVESMIRCAEFMQDTPFEAYINGFVYPEMIDLKDSIPNELLTPKLSKFKEDFINGKINITSFINDLNKRVAQLNHLSRETMTYAKIASDCLPEFKNEQALENLIKSANEFKDSPYECFVMKSVYPEIIKMYNGIPDNLISDRLMQFKKDLIKNDIEALKLFVKLQNMPLAPDHLAYYFIIKNSLDEINPCIKEEAKQLLEIKTKQVTTRIRELEIELNQTVDLSKCLSTINSPDNAANAIRLMHDLYTNSDFQTIMELPKDKKSADIRI